MKINGRPHWLGDSFGKPLDGGIPGKGGGLCLFLAFAIIGLPVGFALASVLRVIS